MGGGGIPGAGLAHDHVRQAHHLGHEWRDRSRGWHKLRQSTPTVWLRRPRDCPQTTGFTPSKTLAWEGGDIPGAGFAHDHVRQAHHLGNVVDKPQHLCVCV